MNPNFSKAIALLIAMLMLLSLFACNLQKEENTPSPDHPSQSSIADRPSTPPVETTTSSVETSAPSVETTTLPIETSAPSVETTTLPIETSASSAETTAPPIETSAPSVETTLPIETSAPSAETTTPPIETSTPSVETTAPPIETSAPSAETTTPPIETSTPSVETTTPPIETSAPSGETNSPNHTTDVISPSMTWLAIGDSITCGELNDGVSYADYAAKRLGITLIKEGVSGSTISDMYARVANGEFDDCNPDLITVLGGTNDWNVSRKSKNADSDTIYTVGTYVAYVNTMIELLQSKFPNAQIVFITCLQRNYFGNDTANLAGTVNANGETLADYRDALIESCAHHSVPVIDLYAESGICATNYLPAESGYSTPSIHTYTVDGLHPNDLGHRRIATIVANRLKDFI